MENDGRALEAPGTLDDAAAFLMDSGVLNDDEPLEEDDSEVETPPVEGAGPEEEDETESEEEDEEESPEPEQTSQKFKVTVKGEDGAEETKEVTQQELIDGYMLKSRFTQLTQGLADRERQAAEVVQRNLQEGRNYYMQEAQKAHQAVRALAGIRSEQEMQQLAVQDPTAWVQERQRQEAIQNILQQINAGVMTERQRAEQEHAQQLQQVSQRAWQELSKDGIDRQKLEGIFTSFAKEYGMDMQQVANVYDPRVVRAMRDAVEYRALKNQTAKQKTPAKAAVPAGRKSVPASTEKAKQLDRRFTKGQAKLRDLASFIQTNS